MRLTGLSLTAVLLTFLIMSGWAFYYPLIALVFLLIQGFWLWHALRAQHRELAQFFRSIQNADHAFRFDTEHPLSRSWHQELNRINHLIKDLKIKLEAQEKFYHILLEKVSTGILTVDSKGFVNHLNRAALELLNLPILTHLGQLQAKHQRLYNHLKNKAPKERILIPISSAEGQKDISVITQLVQIREESLLLVILQDIRTELDEKELESWIKLIRVQAHEIRNSMAPIAAIAESLLTLELDPDIRKQLTIIAERSHHLHQFVESYQQLTHLPSPILSKVHLPDVIDTVRILLSDLPNFKEVIFRTIGDQQNLLAWADQDQITQVLLNLLRNAYQAVEGCDQAAVGIEMTSKEDGVLIQIIDNGQGIPPDLREEIFVPFFTTKTTGTGIGLSLSKQIIRKHGGALWLQSEEGQGSTFSIRLPAYRSRE